MTFSAAEFDARYRDITLRLTCSSCPEQWLRWRRGHDRSASCWPCRKPRRGATTQPNCLESLSAPARLPQCYGRRRRPSRPRRRSIEREAELVRPRGASRTPHPLSAFEAELGLIQQRGASRSKPTLLALNPVVSTAFCPKSVGRPDAFAVNPIEGIASVVR
jgi:hypothetical protein